PGCRMKQPRQQPQGRGLAGAVRSEEAVHFPGPHPKVEVVHREHAGRISLAEAVGLHGEGLRQESPLLKKAMLAADRRVARVHTHAMKWITRANANVDRVACPWLIKRFVDPQAEFLFVPADEVMATAKREEAIPYDVP